MNEFETYFEIARPNKLLQKSLCGGNCTHFLAYQHSKQGNTSTNGKETYFTRVAVNDAHVRHPARPLQHYLFLHMCTHVSVCYRHKRCNRKRTILALITLKPSVLMSWLTMISVVSMVSTLRTSKHANGTGNGTKELIHVPKEFLTDSFASRIDREPENIRKCQYPLYVVSQYCTKLTQLKAPKTGSPPQTYSH